jgi:hypothetical protein
MREGDTSSDCLCLLECESALCISESVKKQADKYVVASDFSQSLTVYFCSNNLASLLSTQPSASFALIAEWTTSKRQSANLYLVIKYRISIQTFDLKIKVRSINSAELGLPGKYVQARSKDHKWMLQLTRSFLPHLHSYFMDIVNNPNFLDLGLPGSVPATSKSSITIPDTPLDIPGLMTLRQMLILPQPTGFHIYHYAPPNQGPSSPASRPAPSNNHDYNNKWSIFQSSIVVDVRAHKALTLLSPVLGCLVDCSGIQLSFAHFLLNYLDPASACLEGLLDPNQPDAHKWISSRGDAAGAEAKAQASLASARAEHLAHLQALCQLLHRNAVHVHEEPFDPASLSAPAPPTADHHIRGSQLEALTQLELRFAQRLPSLEEVTRSGLLAALLQVCHSDVVVVCLVTSLICSSPVRRVFSPSSTL